MVCKKPGHEEGSNKCEYYEPQVDVTTFAGANDPLSNFYGAPFDYNNIEVSSSEQAYQYQKALRNGMPDMAKQILNAKSPNEAKSMGRYIKCSPTWEQENLDLMEQIVAQKFSQVPEAKKALLKTGETTLVEAVPWQFFWGSGLSREATFNTMQAVWPGENAMGKILEKTRKTLREKQVPENKKQESPRSPLRDTTRNMDRRGSFREKRKLSDKSNAVQSPSRRQRTRTLTNDNWERYRSQSSEPRHPDKR